MSKDLVAEFDQMATNCENIAELVATYYKSLKLKGVPRNLAHDLVCEFNRALWSVLNTNMRPNDEKDL